MKQSLWNLLKLVIGLGLLVYLYTLLEDPAGLWRQIVEADKWLLAAGACCYAAAVALGGYKWGLLLESAGIQVSLGRLLAYQWVAEFFNNFLPAQVGGDVMRGIALASDTHRTADVAASVLIDRFIGLMVFMVAAAFGSAAMLVWGRPDGLPFTPEQRVSVQLIALGSGGASLLLLAMLVAILSRRLKLWVERLLNRLSFLRFALPIWTKLAEAFNVYRHEYRALLLTALCSALIVLLTSVNIWLIAEAIQPNSISMLEVLTINPIIVFVGLVLPLSPGGLGVRQSAFAATFLLMGAGGELGFAVGLLQQFIGYLVSLPGGYWWVRGNARRAANHHPVQPTPSDT
ncbi:MAG: flippase-like domain-containing protein [Caldilineaceae bacterium]|nr:flippase-like domain-containing protein [Caldilineaceae bacterium]